MLGISIGLNAVSDHAVCTAVYVAIAAIVACILGSIQTLGRLSWLAWIGLFSILTSSKCFLDNITLSQSNHHSLDRHCRRRHPRPPNSRS